MTSLVPRQPTSPAGSRRPTQKRSAAPFQRGNVAPAVAAHASPIVPHHLPPSPARTTAKGKEPAHAAPLYTHTAAAASATSVSDASSSTDAADPSGDDYDDDLAHYRARMAAVYGYGAGFERADTRRAPIENWLDHTINHGIPRMSTSTSASGFSRAPGSSARDAYDWEEDDDTPELSHFQRVSHSSSTRSHFDTPPRTPVDGVSFIASHQPVVVAAPIADVGTMDALVDGMNGFGADDFFMGTDALSARERPRHGGKRPVFDPLYQPPLPTPPPGVVLGGRLGRRESVEAHSGDDEQSIASRPSPPRRRRTRKAENSRTPSTATITQEPPESPVSLTFPPHQPTATRRVPRPAHIPPPISESTATYPSPPRTEPKAIVPSISDIIKKHPQVSSRPPSRVGSTLSRSSSCAQGQRSPPSGPSTPSVRSSRRESGEDTEFLTADEGDLVSRTSIDSIAAEVQRTLRTQTAYAPKPSPLHHAHSFPRRPLSAVSGTSDGLPAPSVYSSSAASQHRTMSPVALSTDATTVQTVDASQTIATYLRSTRITTLLRLTRGPHASREAPLTVSLCDLGSPDGFPLVVFLGLGCVRHVMGLYDETAELLGLRIIAIDRWGLGRTGSPRSKYARGVAEWASVVVEVLDQLGIPKCSVMAHSAGAPYALAFANRAPERILGDVCLLAPWVGGTEASGYKWLKYVPNGIIKTAQAAEWKIQAWMIGKPPKIALQGIGYDARAPLSSDSFINRPATPESGILVSPVEDPRPRRSMTGSGRSRPSVGSGGTFSDYDDLNDFDGRFNSSGSTLGLNAQRTRAVSGNPAQVQKKAPKGFLQRLKSGNSQPKACAVDPKSAGVGPNGKKLKGLRSLSSLKNKPPSAPVTTSRPSTASRVVPSLNSEVSLDLGAVDWQLSNGHDLVASPLSYTASRSQVTVASGRSIPSQLSYQGSSARRSISMSGPRPSYAQSLPTSPNLNIPSSLGGAESPDGSYQGQLANALIAASHAEASKGVHGDLVQILNHDGKPWGFSYAAFPHPVRVWYGDKDEKIAENAVRWMERTMGPDNCHVCVVKGADHALMYNSSVVMEVLECVGDSWQRHSRAPLC